MPRSAPLALFLLSSALLGSALSAATLKFDFGIGRAAPDHTLVTPETTFTHERGYGFEPGAELSVNDRGGGQEAALARSHFITSAKPFHFTARVPQEGNYRVTVTLGDAAGESVTTIKAELRRLMVAEEIRTARGEFKTVSFIVNTRTPTIVPVGEMKPGVVRLKAPRESVQEAWAWDDAITLEFSNTRPAVCGVTIEPVSLPTIFLLGDSTVCDQSKEPFNSWGQMFTRFFKPEVAIANHGESGETFRDSIGRRRLDKILSVMQPGDWLLMQFGHNDQKQIEAKSGGPFTTYQAEIKIHVESVRARGGIPVIVSPMERRGFDEHGKVRPSLADYANAARQAAQDLGVAFIDLNAMSRPFYEALGPEKSARAFAAPGGRVDNTHHNNYGSYELAKCVVQAIRDQQLPIAKFVVDDFKAFDPAHPDDPDAFAVPASGEFTNQRPLGDEANK
jgi:lysophospholipase L1-like esterase